MSTDIERREMAEAQLLNWSPSPGFTAAEKAELDEHCKQGHTCDACDKPLDVHGGAGMGALRLPPPGFDPDGSGDPWPDEMPAMALVCDQACADRLDSEGDWKVPSLSQAVAMSMVAALKSGDMGAMMAAMLVVESLKPGGGNPANVLSGLFGAMGGDSIADAKPEAKGSARDIAALLTGLQGDGRRTALPAANDDEPLPGQYL